MIRIIIITALAFLCTVCSHQVKQFRIESSINEIYYTTIFGRPDRKNRIFWKQLYAKGALIENKHLENCLNNLDVFYDEYALEDIDAFIKEYPKIHYGYEIKGDILSFLKDDQAAISAYEHAQRLLPEVVSPLSLYFKILALDRNLDNKINLTSIMLGLNPEQEVEADIRLIRSSVYISQNKYNDAINELTACIKLSDRFDAEAYSERGRCYSMLEQPYKAIADYTSSIKLNYNPHSLIFMDRATLYRKTNQLDKACEDYKIVIDNSSPKRAEALQESCKVFGCNLNYVKNGFESIKDDNGNIIQKNIYRNGKLGEIMLYRDGTLNGPSKSWYENGQLQSISYYTNDNIDSLYMWHPNGVRKRYTVYKNYEEVLDSSWDSNNTLIQGK